MGNLGNKTDEIEVRKVYIIFKTIVYLVLGIVTVVAGVLYPETIKAMYPTIWWSKYIVLGLALIFLSVSIYTITKFNKSVVLYERGFSYNNKRYEWKDIESITWVSKPYRILGFIPIPLITYRHLSSIPMDSSPLLPELSDLYLKDVYYKFSKASQDAKRNNMKEVSNGLI